MLTGLVVLGILLAVSAAGNAYQYSRALEDATRYGTTKQLAEDAKAGATACTASVDKLADAGKARQARLERALLAVAPAVRADQEAALRALTAKPDDASDPCGSLERYWKAQIKAEREAAK